MSYGKKFALASFLICLALTLRAASASTTVTLNSSDATVGLEDNYGYQNQPDTVQCSDGTCTNFYVGGREGDRNYHAALKINISSIPTGATDINATLWMQSWETSSDNVGVTWHHITLQAWNESTLTYNNFPCSTGDFTNSSDCNATAAGNKTGVITNSTWYGFDITNGVVRDLAAVNMNSSYAFRLDPQDTIINNYKEFNSSEDGRGFEWYVNVTYEFTPTWAIAINQTQQNDSVIYTGSNLLTGKFNSSTVSYAWFSSNESGSWRNYTGGTYPLVFHPRDASLTDHRENFTTTPTYWNDTDTGTASSCANCDLLLNYSYTQDNYTFTIRYTETALDEEMSVRYWNATSGAWQLLQTLPVSALNEVGINMTIPEVDSVGGKLLMDVHLASTGGTGGVYEVSMENTSLPVTNSSMIRWYDLDWQNLSMPIESYVNWTMYLNNTDGDEAMTDYSVFQIIQPFIGACGAGYAKAKHLVVLNETKPFESINGTMDVNLQMSMGGVTYVYNFTATNTTWDICISPATGNYTVSGQISYYNGTGATPAYPRRDYFLISEVFDNSTEDLGLYLLPYGISTLISFKIQDQYATPMSGALLKIQRWYPDLDIYKTIAAPETDVNGVALVYLVEYDAYYRFLIYNSAGTLLQTIPSMLISGNSITLSTSTDVQGTYGRYIWRVYGTCTYSNSTRYLSCSYTDMTGMLSNVTLKVTRQGALIQSTLCDYANLTEGTGTFRCYLGENPDASIVYSMMAHMEDNTLWPLESRPIPYGSTSTTLFGDCTSVSNMGACKEGLMVSFFIILTLAVIGAWNPIVSVVFTTAGLAITIMTGLIALSPIYLLSLILVASMMIYRMRD